MHRLNLMTYEGLIVTPDMAEALRALELAASKKGKWLVRYIKGDRPAYEEGSLVPAGREVKLTFHKDGAGELEALHAAWGCAVPLGFTPKLRDPLLEPGHTVFRYFGPWQAVYGKMLAEGRGHLAWPSLCAAAQVDVGAWEGGKTLARFVQAQVHRLGRNPGPIDGVVGPRTAAAIASLSIAGETLSEVAAALAVAEPSKKSTGSVTRGHLHLPSHPLVVEAYGGVKSWVMDNGAGFEVSGAGRIVVDIR